MEELYRRAGEGGGGETFAGTAATAARRGEFDRKKRSVRRGGAPYHGLERRQTAMHRTVEPAILYFGTPVVLVSSLNEDGSPNVAPISSAWWLGWSCMLGFGARSHTPANILRTGECVLNLPSVEQAAAVDRLARLTGSNPVPPHKLAMGYRHERDKLGAAGLTALPSDTVAPPRVRECPVQLEATLEDAHPILARDEAMRGKLVAIEVRVRRVHVEESLLMDGFENRIDPRRWRPLIMSFQQFFGLTPETVHGSRLGEIPESMYRTPPPPAFRPAAPLATSAVTGSAS
jgi:flavin reductase (DIM6/NTAB) family NADH-FMN oxidoreductase RutF